MAWRETEKHMVGVRLGNVRSGVQPVFLQGMRILKKEREGEKRASEIEKRDISSMKGKQSSFSLQPFLLLK